MGSRRSNRGFVLAEYLVAVALLLTIATAALGGLAFAASSNANSATRARAVQLANQCIEQARNLPYDSVGTVSGFPAGIIPDTNAVGNLTAKTVVEWAFDKVTHAQTCKSITVTVSWTAGGPGSVALQSSIFGKSSIKNVGDVTIAVVDEDTTKPIQGATIQITAVTGVANTKSTDASGSAMWGQVPSGKLVISGTATGYILKLSPVSNAAVIANQMNSWTISAAKPSKGVVTVKDQSGKAVAGATVTIVGPSGTLSAVTASDGTAAFMTLLKGTYAVTTLLSGYAGGSGTLGVILGGSEYACGVTVTKVTTLKIVANDAGTGLSDVGLTVTPAGATGPAKTGADGSATFVVTGPGPYSVTASKTGYVTGSATSKALVVGAENLLTVPLTPVVPCTLNLVVVDQSSVAVSGATVSVTGPGSVTGVFLTDSFGKGVYKLSMPGVYTVQVSKANYTTTPASTGSIANGATKDITMIMPKITTGTLAVKYTGNASGWNPKTVYVYDASHVSVTSLIFTSQDQTINAPLPAGLYYASRNSWYATPPSATVPVNVTGYVSVSWGD